MVDKEQQLEAVHGVSIKTVYNYEQIHVTHDIYCQSMDPPHKSFKS